MIGDLISRQAAIDALGDEPEVWSEKDEYEQGLNNQWHYDVNALKAVPSAERHGRWIDLQCDQCGQVDMSKPNYCPNCGAKMDKEEKE